MENKLSLSIILPIKSSIVRDFDEFFDKAINSLKTQMVSFLSGFVSRVTNNHTMVVIPTVIKKLLGKTISQAA